MSDTIDGLWQFVVFRLHAREYALPVGQVVEVLHMVAMTPLPEAPAWLPGVIDLRGQVIPILDLRTRLGLRPQAPDLDTAIVVVDADGRILGLIADAVVEILTFPPESIAPPGALAGSTHTIAGVACVGGRLIMIFDVHALYPGAESMLPAA